MEAPTFMDWLTHYAAIHGPEKAIGMAHRQIFGTVGAWTDKSRDSIRSPSRPVSASDGGRGGGVEGHAEKSSELVLSGAGGESLPWNVGEGTIFGSWYQARPAPTVIGTPGALELPVTERASARPREDDA